jgi:hypothetical protein
LTNKLSVSTQTTNSRGGKNFEDRLNEPHTLITVGVSLFLEQPPQDGNGNSFLDYAYSQDVVAMLAQLPGSPVKTQHPRLGELQSTHDNFRNFRIIKLEVAEKAL